MNRGLESCVTLSERVYAAPSDPWDQAVQVLQTAFTGPIATRLALVAIVVGGLMFAFGEGAAKRTLAGVIFGVGMAVGESTLWRGSFRDLAWHLEFQLRRKT